MRHLHYKFADGLATYGEWVGDIRAAFVQESVGSDSQKFVAD
jgi:hypothetical protein